MFYIGYYNILNILEKFLHEEEFKRALHTLLLDI